MDNHEDTPSRLDAGLRQIEVDLHEAQYAVSNLQSTLRELRMLVEVWNHRRAAEIADLEARLERVQDRMDH